MPRNRDALFELFVELSVRARLLREYQDATKVHRSDLNERELLVLELLSRYPTLDKVALAKIFGVGYGSIHHVCTNLEGKRLIEQLEESDENGKSLGMKPRITSAGKARLEEHRVESSQRYDLLFRDSTDAEIEAITSALKKVNEAAGKALERFFGGGTKSASRKR